MFTAAVAVCYFSSVFICVVAHITLYKMPAPKPHHIFHYLSTTLNQIANTNLIKKTQIKIYIGISSTNTTMAITVLAPHSPLPGIICFGYFENTFSAGHHHHHPATSAALEPFLKKTNAAALRPQLSLDSGADQTHEQHREFVRRISTNPQDYRNGSGLTSEPGTPVKPGKLLGEFFVYIYFYRLYANNYTIECRY